MIKRLRLQFARGDKLKFLSHLDMMRLWPRLFRRAGIDMTYSEGFNAHPRLAVAAPLAVGWTGETELMEVWLEAPPPLPAVLARLAPVLPEGLAIVQGLIMPMEDPSLQSLMRFAEYIVTMTLDRPAADVGLAVDNLMALSTLDWAHTRDEETRRYDLRAQVDHLAIHAVDTVTVTLSMRLKNAPSGSGRPEQVALALGFAEHPLSIHRTRLVLA